MVAIGLALGLYESLGLARQDVVTLGRFLGKDEG
jgi:hypothetical protein